MGEDGSNEAEPKSERFNMFISKSEMEAIDEWAWANKIRSKSEAVRRLCQIGLLVEHHLGLVLENAEDVRRGLDIMVGLTELSTKSSPNIHAEDIRDFAEDVAEAGEELMIEVTGFWNSVVPFSDAIDVSAARRKSAAEVEKAVQLLEDHYTRAVERQDLRLMMFVIDDMSDEQIAAYEAMDQPARDAFMSGEIDKLSRKRFLEAMAEDDEK